MCVFFYIYFPFCLLHNIFPLSSSILLDDETEYGWRIKKIVRNSPLLFDHTGSTDTNAIESCVCVWLCEHDIAHIDTHFHSEPIMWCV